MKQHITVKKDGKKIGIINNTTFTTRRKPEHYFLKHKGYGISQTVLDFLESKKVEQVRIVTPQRTHEIPLESYSKSKKTHTHYDREGKTDFQRFVEVSESQSNNKPSKYSNKEDKKE